MTTITFYRQEAQRHRELAAAEPNPRFAQQLLAFARDYDGLADTLEEAGANGDDTEPPPRPTGPVQHQPMQQQQQQKKEDDK